MVTSLLQQAWERYLPISQSNKILNSYYVIFGDGKLANKRLKPIDKNLICRLDRVVALLASPIEIIMVKDYEI